MAMVDPFTPDAFSLTTLTQAINNLKYKPGRLGELGLFQEQGIATLDAAVEERDGVLSLLDIAPRGAPGKPAHGEARRIHTFRVPHIPQMATILADEVQGIRAFGSESQSEVLATRLSERLATLRANLDYTLESHRVAALMGNFYDANGNATSLFTTFGVSQQTLSFVLGTATTKIRSKINTALEYIETALDGVTFTGVRVLCGKTFWDNLVTHEMVEKTYLNTQMAADLRRDPRLEFEFGGFTFERYRGTSAVKIGDTDAYAVPMGIPGLFLTRFAPANYTETVNTLGLPYYAKSEPMKMGKGYDIEAQSNPLNLCTRPAAIIKLTVS